MILVTGFGAFGSVMDNPAAQAAAAVHGRRVAGETVIGRVIPVSYARGPDATVRLARALQPRLVLGLGVADRPTVNVEARGQAQCGTTPDVDDVVLDSLGDAPSVEATLDVTALAAALGADLSHDAGSYVCNAWLYRVASALPMPVGFVHVPPEGIEVQRLLTGLRALL